MNDRIVAEVEFGRRISGVAERIWGWESPAGQRRAARRARLLSERAGLAPGVRALEVGCGIGLFTEPFARSGAELTSIDISPDLLQIARRRVGDGVRFVVANAEATGFPAGSFDVIVGSSILHHLHVFPALAEFRRVLVPGGRLVLSEPNMLNPQVFITKNVPLVKRWAGDLPHETAFLRWRLSRTLCDAGFVRVRVEPYEFLHPATPVSLLDRVSKLTDVLETTPLVREIAGSLFVSAEAGDQ
jgi:SAM-dependent methyltransferase